MWAAADGQITSTVVTASVTLLVGLFGGGGLVALLKVSADRGKIVVEAAQGAVIVQTSVIDDLHAELARVKSEMVVEREQRRLERVEFQGALAALQVENTSLRLRVSAVENGG